MRLKGKTAVVTGGTRGIGRAIVEELLKEEACVLFTFLSHDALAGEIELKAKALGGIALGFKLDVRDFQGINRWREQILERFERIDILINNAGIIRDKALAMMNKEDWDEVIDVNLGGVFNFTRAFIIGFLKQKRGNIINITSVSGITGLPRQVNYSASKGGIISFTRALAREVAPYNIRVNAIAPGFIETGMLSGLKENFLKETLNQIPLARFGKAAEVAKAAAFLASEESGYITGQVIRVDGGLMM